MQVDTRETPLSFNFAEPTDLVGQTDGETITKPAVGNLTISKSPENYLTVLNRR